MYRVIHHDGTVKPFEDSMALRRYLATDREHVGVVEVGTFGHWDYVTTMWISREEGL